MAWKRNVLVIANVTATSDELLDALKERAAREAVAFTLIVPATPFGGGRAAAAKQLEAAVERMRDGGLEAEGSVGDADPMTAVAESWDPRRYDEIVVCTLPMRVSKWLRAGLPERIEHLTGARVTHVVAEPPKPPVATSPAPAHEPAPMGPLSVLSWGGHKQR